jgi:hypothetical protein
MTSRKKPQKKNSKVPFYVGGGIAALLLIAFITTGLGGGDDGNGNGGPDLQEYADVSVSGGALPPFSQDTTDAAVGLAMPEVTGESFDGTPVSITNDGRPKVIFFLAHW